MAVLFSLYVIILVSKLLQQSECSTQAIYHKRKGKYLANYVIRTTKAKSEQECATHCFKESQCASVNFKTSGDGKGLCELNSKTLDEESNEATHDLEFNHLDIVKRVRFVPEIKAGSMKFSHQAKVSSLSNHSTKKDCRI